jgi:hypothetical protein
MFQGAWFIIMGGMLSTSALIPNGFFLKFEEDHDVVRMLHQRGARPCQVAREHV